jgi:hypothetical protein
VRRIWRNCGREHTRAHNRPAHATLAHTDCNCLSLFTLATTGSHYRHTLLNNNDSKTLTDVRVRLMIGCACTLHCRTPLMINSTADLELQI